MRDLLLGGLLCCRGVGWDGTGEGVTPQLTSPRGVAYGPAERLGDVLDHGGEAKGAEGAEGESPDHGVVAGAIALEGIDAHDGEVGLGVRVIAEVEVHHLLYHLFRVWGVVY